MHLMFIGDMLLLCVMAITCIKYVGQAATSADMSRRKLDRIESNIKANLIITVLVLSISNLLVCLNIAESTQIKDIIELASHISGYVLKAYCLIRTFAFMYFCHSVKVKHRRVEHSKSYREAVSE